MLSPGYSGTPPSGSRTACSIVPMELPVRKRCHRLALTRPFSKTYKGDSTLFEAGDVLFAKITPCMENGKGAFVATLPTRYAFGSTEFHVLRPMHDVLGRFLYYYTFNPVFRAWAAENMTGAAGQKRVSSRFLKDTRIFLPSITEQQLIVDFLDVSCCVVEESRQTKQGMAKHLGVQACLISDDSTSCLPWVADSRMRHRPAAHQRTENLNQVKAHG